MIQEKATLELWKWIDEQPEWFKEQLTQKLEELSRAVEPEKKQVPENTENIKVERGKSKVDVDD